ncbi:MAG: hypothetical protein RLZ98_218 [Pseudomonadota bacterium]|jgi:uncharacterized protein (TIGR02186 family)
MGQFRRPVIRCLLALLVLTGMGAIASAQDQGLRGSVGEPSTMATAARQEASLDRPETVQADVSTRSVSVTSSFTGTEIVIFGAIDNSRGTSPENTIYDVVIIVEGGPASLVARRKENVAGLWLNASSVPFEQVPSYYAIASTRPVDEISDPSVLKRFQIGFSHVKMKPSEAARASLDSKELDRFRQSVIRLKRREGLYREDEFGVVFVGSSLFRTTIELPANVPVGPMDARVFLFRDGKMLSRFQTRVNLQREGLEAFLHTFAFSYPFIYGVFTVILSVAAGLLASTFFDRARH